MVYLLTKYIRTLSDQNIKTCSKSLYRYSFCSVPVNDTAMLIIGGYSQDGPLSSVELLDIKSGRWEKLPDLPQPRYGHACLLMELAGQEGVMV